MYEEAREFINRKAQLVNDPAPYGLNLMSHKLGEYERALEEMKATFETDTTNIFYMNQLAENYDNLNHWDSAIHYFEKALAGAMEFGIGSGVPFWSFYYRYGYALSEAGDSAKAMEMFDKHISTVTEQMEGGDTFAGHYYDLGFVYAYTGQREKALKILKEAPRNGALLGMLERDPMLASLRGDPEFEELMEKWRNQVQELREAVGIDQYEEDLDWLLNF